MAKTLQVTISGKDGGGYVWQNVFHVTSTDEIHSEHDILSALVDAVDDVVRPAMVFAMNESVTILDIAARLIGGAAGYTFHKPVSFDGSRGGDATAGAIAGKLAFYPETGAHIGHMFVAGVQADDYVNDSITDGYATLLRAIADALESFDGTDATYAWQFVIYNRKTLATIAVASAAALLTVGVLSKRVRA
jgi:hypothetical protein